MAGRADGLSRSLEDYLEAVLMLLRRRGVARVRDIAASLRVSKPSVTAAVKQLSRARLVDHGPYESVRLTARGRSVGRRIRDKHVALRSFLVEVLGIDDGSAEANACRMEHVVDDVVLRRLGALHRHLRGRSGTGQSWRKSPRSRRRGAGGKAGVNRANTFGAAEMSRR